MQKRKIMEVNEKSARNGFNLGLGSDHARVSSLIIRKFPRCFSLYFNVSVDVVRMFLYVYMFSLICLVKTVKNTKVR